MSYHFKLNIENTQKDVEIALVAVFAEQHKKQLPVSNILHENLVEYI